MPSSPEDRLRVAAVISALKAAGVRVKNWKNFLNGESTHAHGDRYKQERPCNIFAFGRDLALLPQCHLPELGGTVPRFLVDSCEFLSRHLHTEGLFRKTGSLSRIRALRVGLEQGEPVFSPALCSSLQPCDVASLLKQFLRELPSPLVPVELQGPLCRAQGLGPDGGREGGRDGATLLVTALFPPSHTRALRYLCTFLRSAAQRCSENRMEVGSLALVMAPNLLQGLVPGCKLTVGTERLLERQAAVISALITHAERIGVVPSVIMEALSISATPLAEGVGFQGKAGLSVYRSLRRQRRRSVGEMFVDALSKLKTGRTPNGPSQPSDAVRGQQVAASAIPQSPSTIKRKASEDTLPEVEGSAKKRRSIHDLREDNQPTSLSLSDESESPLSRSPTPSLCSVISGVQGSEEQGLLGPQTRSAKKRNHRRDTKRVQRIPAPEDRAQRRRRSLRFFTASGWSSASTAPSDGHEEVVVGTEVDDDPDTLNCCFMEDPQDTFVTSRRIWSATQLERTGVAGWADNGAGDGLAQGGGAVAGAGREMIGLVAHRDTGIKPEGEGPREWRDPMLDVFRRVSRGYRPPRRSISLPEVMVDGDEEEEGGEFGGSGFHECAWTVGDSLKNGNGQSEQARVGGGGGGEAEEIQQNGHGKHKETEREKKGKKEEKRRVAREGGGKGEESGLGFLRSHQRMSVADRVRRFNVLSAWLRGPRPPPVPPAPQRGPVRLRRQGARRFSRSISHEGVAGLLQEPQSQELPEHPVSPLSPHNPRESLNPSNPHNPLNPSSPLNSHDPPNPSNPLNSHDPLNPSNPLNYHDLLNSSNPLNSHDPLNPHNPNLLNPSCPNLPNPLEPINPPELSSKPSEPQHHHPSQRLSPNPGGQRLKEPAQGPGGRPPQHPEQEAQEGKNGPPEPGLHELLELQLRIQHLEPPASQTSLCLTSPSPLEGPAKNARSPCLLSLPAPLPHHTDARSRRDPAASPPMWPLSPSDPCRPLEAGQCADSAPEISAGSDHSPALCADGSNEMGTGGGDPRPSLSPLALRFRAPAVRRRYRDSPRWPIPEIHITTLTPFQL